MYKIGLEPKINQSTTEYIGNCVIGIYFKSNYCNTLFFVCLILIDLTRSLNHLFSTCLSLDPPDI